ncbi:MAG: DUF6483 family protein [Spirochaetaceae bacterium]|jgi:hypothetical protein|nr:DUF6483 family protein [Spirochaetaceae bacterium]
MVQRDYIVRIIEQFAAFLWAIIFNKKIRNYDIALEKIEEAYNELLNSKSNKIKSLEVDEIVKSNTYEKVLNTDNIEIIANLLSEEADIIEQINGLNRITSEYYQKSFVLFYVLANKMNTRKHDEKIDEIISKLNDYELIDETRYKIYEYYEEKGLYGKAEDKLYELKEDNYPNITNTIKIFYERMLEKDNETLEKGNLPRNEILEEMDKL